MTATIYDFEEHRRRKQVLLALDDLRRQADEFDLSWDYLMTADSERALREIRPAPR